MPRIALGQLNLTVGDLDGNVARMAEAAAKATEAGADLICFPELAVTGYPPEDLVLRPEFVRDNLEALEELARGDRRAAARWSPGSSIAPTPAIAQRRGLPAARRRRGRATTRSQLPNFGVFDEQRYFVPGDRGRHASTSTGRRSASRSARTPGTTAPPFTGYAGLAADREHQRLAVPPRQDRRARGRAARPRAARPAPGSCT